MNSDEQFAWDLVKAAAVLSVPAVPMAAALLVGDQRDTLPADTTSHLLALLQTRGSIAPTPAAEALLGAWRAAHVPGVARDELRRCAAWSVVRALELEAHADAAMQFMCAIASAQARRVERELAALS